MSGSQTFHRPFDVRRVGSEPVLERVSASPEECTAIARFFGILSVGRVEADLVIAPWSGSGIEIKGRLRADVVQPCVVTLDPVPQAIDQPFVLTFLPPEARAADPKTVAEAEVIVHFDEDDPPDPLDGPVLDLGEIVVEQLALALDPYPRAPGAALQGEYSSDEAGRDSPFAALSRLRDK